MPNILLKVDLGKEKDNSSKVMGLIVSELRSLRSELKRTRPTKPTVVVVGSGNEKRFKALDKRISKVKSSGNKALVRELKGIKARVAKKPRVVTVTKNIIKKQVIKPKVKIKKVLFSKPISRKKKKRVSVSKQKTNQRLAHELKLVKSQLEALPITNHMGAG